MTRYPSEHSSHFIWTLDGPSMVTDSALAPAPQVFTTNSDATPEDQMNRMSRRQPSLASCGRSRRTCGSTLQTWAKDRHQAWISLLARFSHSDLEGTSRNVTAIEAHMDGMITVLSRDKPDSMLV